MEVAHPQSVLRLPDSWSNLPEFGNAGFWRERKTEVPGEKLLGARERTNNKLNPHIMASTPGFEPGPHWWKASALTTAPSLAPQRRSDKSNTRRSVSSNTHPRRTSGNQSGREKGRDEVFKYGRKSPWVSTLTELFPKIQADAGSWLGTKNALYYCAQSANSFTWVLFVSSYTTAIVSITACLAHAPKKFRQSGTFSLIYNPHLISKYCLPESYRRFSKNTSLSLQEVFTLASVTSYVNIREFLKDTTTADYHENITWKRKFTFFQFLSISICQGKRTLLELNFYQHIQVYEENEFCHCLFTSFT